jgi:uncharacterized membrane protein (DUF106 family)
MVPKHLANYADEEVFDDNTELSVAKKNVFDRLKELVSAQQKLADVQKKMMKIRFENCKS